MRATTTAAPFSPRIKDGFRVAREGRKHVMMSDGNRFFTIPRNDSLDTDTMGGIVTDAGLGVEEFKKLL